MFVRLFALPLLGREVEEERNVRKGIEGGGRGRVKRGRNRERMEGV